MELQPQCSIKSTRNSRHVSPTQRLRASLRPVCYWMPPILPTPDTAINTAMPPMVNCAVTAFLLQVLSLSCSHTTRSTAFLSQPNFAHTQLANARTSTTYSSKPSSLEVIRSKRGRAVDSAKRGGDDVGGNRTAPVTVLDRPWDVEVLLHGERRVITVQPGDSVLEAVSVFVYLNQRKE